LNNKKVLLLILSAVLFILAASFELYKGSAPRENKLYIVREKEANRDISAIDSSITARVPSPFYELPSALTDDSHEQIPVTLSPDKRYLYFMAPSIVKVKAGRPTVIKGPTTIYMSLIKKELSTGKSSVIIPELPFITTVKWSPNGNIAAFSGGGKLTVYDAVEEREILAEELKNEQVQYFGWSPDGKKLYTEQSNLPNGFLLYTDIKKKVEPYEVKEDIFFKLPIDKSYYYGTKQIIKPTSLLGSSSCSTVVADKNGSAIKELAEGCLRDAYDNSLLIIDRDGYLKFIKDHNLPEKIRQITRERVYDAKFVNGGGFAFTTMNNSIDSNTFFLHVADNNGEEIGKFEVSGSSFLLHPDGNSAYAAGELRERIDFIKNICLPSLPAESYASEQESILRTLRGALQIVQNYIITSEVDTALASSYFDTSAMIKQLSYIDSKNLWKDEDLKSLFLKQNWNITMKLKDYIEFDENKKVKARLKLDISASALWVEELRGTFEVKLEQKGTSWLIVSVTPSK
jgi:hypothetical protein